VGYDIAVLFSGQPADGSTRNWVARRLNLIKRIPASPGVNVDQFNKHEFRASKITRSERKSDWDTANGCSIRGSGVAGMTAKRIDKQWVWGIFDFGACRGSEARHTPQESPHPGVLVTCVWSDFSEKHNVSRFVGVIEVVCRSSY
jgi:hypothetical protein